MWPSELPPANASAQQAAVLSVLKASGGIAHQKVVVQSAGKEVAEYDAAQVRVCCGGCEPCVCCACAPACARCAQSPARLCLECGADLLAVCAYCRPPASAGCEPGALEHQQQASHVAHHERQRAHQPDHGAGGQPARCAARPCVQGHDGRMPLLLQPRQPQRVVVRQLLPLVLAALPSARACMRDSVLALDCVALHRTVLQALRMCLPTCWSTRRAATSRCRAQSSTWSQCQTTLQVRARLVGCGVVPRRAALRRPRCVL